ncbi:MAG: hypothetical protein KAT04_05485, partial [Methylococcales bacterium]|nr:hypothetical protein [Methylococcales bacterium]
IIASWVFFRADTLTQAMDYFSAMASIANWHTTALQYAQVISNESIYVFAIGLIFSLPIYTWLKHHLTTFSENSTVKVASLIYIPRLAFLSALLMLSILKVASSTYNPFIYFRF